MAGARALWRATGMTDADFGKPIVADRQLASPSSYRATCTCATSGMHRRRRGRRGRRGRPSEFNTIAVDDGIAMGHGGMLYSLPSRELIADAVEYMVQAHCADALVCISNCDKITPGMLLAALRLNIPTVFVSGGPMEAGKTVAIEGVVHAKLDLIDAMIASANEAVTDEQLGGDRALGLPDLRLLLRHVHRQLDELPHRGDRPGPARQRLDPGHPRRPPGACSTGPATLVVDLARRYYEQDDALGAAARDRHPGRVRERGRPGRGHGRLDQHRAAPAGRGPRGRGRLQRRPTSTRSPAGCPCLSKVAPNTPKYHMEDVHRAGGIPAILGELDRGRPAAPGRALACTRRILDEWLADWDIRGGTPRRDGARALPRRTRRGPHHRAVLHRPTAGRRLDTDAADGCIRDVAHAYTRRRRPGHPLRQPRPRGLRGQDRRRAGREPDLPRPGQGLRVAGGRRRRPSCAGRSSRATWW